MLNYREKSDDFQEFIGCIDIRDNVFIGTNSTILSNVTVGPDTIIAAGSLVNHSIPGNGVYGGVPARYICSLDDFMQKRKNLPKIEITRGKGGLSEETVAACWKRFSDLKIQQNH